MKIERATRGACAARATFTNLQSSILSIQSKKENKQNEDTKK
jgi:hypothetical protein